MGIKRKDNKDIVEIKLDSEVSTQEQEKKKRNLILVIFTFVILIITIGCILMGYYLTKPLDRNYKKVIYDPSVITSETTLVDSKLDIVTSDNKLSFISTSPTVSLGPLVNPNYIYAAEDGSEKNVVVISWVDKTSKFFDIYSVSIYLLEDTSFEPTSKYRYESLSITPNSKGFSTTLSFANPSSVVIHSIEIIYRATL